MNTTTTDKTWIDLFVVELRLRRVSGSAIGDAVASVRELLADSGQSAEEAFGPAREYAASLDLPVAGQRRQALQIVLPVLGLLAFLVFALASTAWFADAPVLFSVPQVVLLAVPVLLTILIPTPFCLRAIFTRRWLPAALVVVAGLASAGAALLAPSSVEDAWLALPALPLLIGMMAMLVALSAIGTIATLNGDDREDIVDPSQAEGERRSRVFPILVNWIFPLLAIVVLAMSWGFTLL